MTTDSNRREVTRSLRGWADTSAAARVDRLWALLAACPPDAVRWAALGWHAAHAERDLDAARQLAADGLDALAVARPILRHPSFAELQRRRGAA
jgi:hypothetical protein